MFLKIYLEKPSCIEEVGEGTYKSDPSVQRIGLSMDWLCGILGLELCAHEKKQKTTKNLARRQ